MSSFKKKEQNLNQLIDKLNSLSLSYSQPNYEIEKIRTEKNDLTNKTGSQDKKRKRPVKEVPIDPHTLHPRLIVSSHEYCNHCCDVLIKGDVIFKCIPCNNKLCLACYRIKKYDDKENNKNDTILNNYNSENFDKYSEYVSKFFLLYLLIILSFLLFSLSSYFLIL